MTNYCVTIIYARLTTSSIASMSSELSVSILQSLCVVLYNMRTYEPSYNYTLFIFIIHKFKTRYLLQPDAKGSVFTIHTCESSLRLYYYFFFPFFAYNFSTRIIGTLQFVTIVCRNVHTLTKQCPGRKAKFLRPRKIYQIRLGTNAKKKIFRIWNKPIKKINYVLRPPKK